ncbi:hypothetical protein ACWEP8_26245 [Streptomyces hydrogenans]
MRLSRLCHEPAGVRLSHLRHEPAGARLAHLPAADGPADTPRPPAP